MEQTRKTYLSGPQVQERYGVTKMTLWRWCENPSMGFPQPLRINGRKYFDVTELDAWDRSRISGAAA